MRANEEFNATALNHARNTAAETPSSSRVSLDSSYIFFDAFPYSKWSVHATNQSAAASPSLSGPAVTWRTLGRTISATTTAESPFRRLYDDNVHYDPLPRCFFLKGGSAKMTVMNHGVCDYFPPCSVPCCCWSQFLRGRIRVWRMW